MAIDSPSRCPVPSVSSLSILLRILVSLHCASSELLARIADLVRSVLAAHRRNGCMYRIRRPPGRMTANAMQFKGLIQPGKKAEITLTAHVDDVGASQFNVGNAHLEDTLVLHTALGRDYFVAVSGEYGSTIFTSRLWYTLICGSRPYLFRDKYRVARASSGTNQGIAVTRRPTS